MLTDQPSLETICHTVVHWLGGSPAANQEDLEPDWATAKYVCRVHGVAPLLYQKLRAAGGIEPVFMEWLHRQYQFNAQRIAKMQAELATILQQFGRCNLPLMPLKGSILAAHYYEEAAWRPMADLDLLIRPEDVEAAKLLLTQLGYEQQVVYWKHIEFVKPANRQVVSLEYEHPDNPRGLELHLYCRETFGGPTIDLTDLMWQYSTQTSLFGQPTRLPEPDVLWLHLLVHATYHIWQGRGRLIHLMDLVLLRPHLQNPTRLLETIDPRYIYPALCLLQKYFPNPLYETIKATQEAQISGTFRRWSESLNVVNTSYLNPKPPGLYLLKALKFAQGHPAEMIQALRFSLWPSLDEIALDHPTLAASKAAWLSYFLLPLDWLKRLAKNRG